VPVLAHRADRDETLVINGQGPTPAAASIARFEELGLNLVPGTGPLSACVPGAFDTWMLLLGEFGTLRLADVMGYANGYAENGYPLVPRISDTIRDVEELFRDEWPSSARLPGRRRRTRTRHPVRQPGPTDASSRRPKPGPPTRAAANPRGMQGYAAGR
jgi:gamma-glutamyltranspeptidase/glutathione hydrolase